MTSNKKKFNSIFIREFRPGGNFESDEVKNVYHYASMETFLSIIKNQSIRFSDVRFMNDKSESIFFVKRLLEFQDEYTNTYPLFSEAINELLKGNDYDAIKNLSVTNIKYRDFPYIKMPEQRNFIFCTSINPDSLNMWNYYASGGTYTGCSIGLSVDSLLKTFDTSVPNTSDPFSVYYGKVLYAKKRQFEAIEELAQRTEKNLRKDHSPQSISQQAVSIRSYIQQQGQFYKDDSFKSENEYRFLISISERRIAHSEEDAKKFFGSNNKVLYEDFCAKRGLIVPYMNVRIPLNAFARITLAPMTEFEIAKNSVKEFLWVHGAKDAFEREVSVCKSRIPIRY